MSRYYGYYLGISLWTILFLYVSPAASFEFSFRGSYSWEYVAYSQLGSKGFFGPYDVDNAALEQGGASSANGWLGYRISSLTTSGTDTANSTMMMDIFPRIKVNEAITIKGQYHVGAWGFSENVSAVMFPADQTPKHWDPVGFLTGSSYSTMTAPGIGQSLSPGYWNTLWVKAQTPWGIVVVGKRPLEFGTGLMFNGADNTSIETIALMVPVGPVRFGLEFYPWRRQIDQGYVDPPRISYQYFNPLDKSSGRRYDLVGFATYDAGSLSVGAFTEGYAFGVGPEAVNNPNDKKRFLPEQLEAFLGGVFLKYFDGRFFLNTEADWDYETTRLQSNMNGNLTPAFPIVVQGALAFNPYLFRKSYIESWRYVVESGIVVGPAKFSLIWSWIPGTDRRHGVVIDRQNLRYDDLLTNSGLFRPYSMIMVNGYGTGNNSVSAITNGGYLTDANAYGIRLDYAAAVNLNIFATAFWAQRVSHGYGWGFIQPALRRNPQTSVPLTGITTGFVEYIRHGTFDTPSPAIPDSNLGYELDVGFGWKLLEGYLLNGTFGFFQPGNWFKFACVDRSNPGWKDLAAPENMFGINPDRNINPIFALDVTLNVGF